MRVHQAFTSLFVFLLGSASSEAVSDRKPDDKKDLHAPFFGQNPERDLLGKLTVLGKDKFLDADMVQLVVPEEEQGHAIDYFGYAVALTGDVAAVAAPFDDKNGELSGAVHIFTRSYYGEWYYLQRLEPDYPMALDHFGRKLVFFGKDGDEGLILGVGAPGRENDNPATESGRPGRIFFFQRQRDGYFTQHSVLEGEENNDSFGQAFSYCPESERLVVGALAADPYRRGKVYVFEKDPYYFFAFWPSAVVWGSDGIHGKFESFGFKVVIKGDDLVVAAPGRDNGRYVRRTNL